MLPISPQMLEDAITLGLHGLLWRAGKVKVGSLPTLQLSSSPFCFWFSLWRLLPKSLNIKASLWESQSWRKVWKYLIQIVECLKQIVEYLKQIVRYLKQIFDYLKQIAEYLKYCLGVLGSYCKRAHINHPNHRAFVERAHWPLKAGRNAYFQIFEVKVLRGNMFLSENGTLSRCAIFQFLRKKLKRTNLAPLKQSF